MRASPPPAKPAAGRRFFVQPYLFLAPAILLVVCVSLYPILFAVRRSLYETRYMALGKFIGIENYWEFLVEGTGWNSLVNSLVYCAGSLLIALPLGFGLALVLNQPLPCRALIRTLLILPWIVSQTIVALLWSWMLNPDYGPLNYAISKFADVHFSVFGDPDLAMIGVIVANAWQSYPLALILILAALQGIPQEVIEAARIDGAGRWMSFWRITLPMVRSTLMITTIMLSLHNFNMLTLIFTLTGGGPVGATETLAVRLFNEAFVFNNLGFASMIGILIAVLNIVFSLGYIRMLRQEN